MRSLGAATFRERYRLQQAYVAGGMYKGIASHRLVTAMANAGYLAFLGTGGMKIQAIQANLQAIAREIQPGSAWGINFLHNPVQPDAEMQLAHLCITQNIRVIESSAFMNITPALVWYRLSGITQTAGKQVVPANHIIAKLSHPLLAEAFLQPPPADMVNKLLQENRITEAEARLAPFVSMASDITMEADSGGHTDQRVLSIILPAVLKMRNQAQAQYQYAQPVHIGAAGGLGTPRALAAAICLGAEYIVTGSINQCTVESGASDLMKDMLNEMTVYDTAYAPAGDLFELGSRIQVLNKGTFFPARARKLYELYKQYPSLEAIPANEKKNLEEKILKKPVAEVMGLALAHIQETRPQEFAEICANPRLVMSNTFKWYFYHSTKIAMNGEADKKADFQIQCGPALGALNDWLENTPYHNWRNRRVAEIAGKLIGETIDYLNSWR